MVSSGSTWNSLISRRKIVFFTIFGTKHLMFWETCCSFLKKRSKFDICIYLRFPRRGQDFLNLACFAWSPIVAPWSAHDRPVIIDDKMKKKCTCTCKCFSIFQNSKNVKICIEKMKENMLISYVFLSIRLTYFTYFLTPILMSHRNDFFKKM